LIGVALAIFVIGMFLPKYKEATRAVKLNTSVDRVWKLAFNHGEETKWRTDLKQIVRLEDRGGQQVWQEIYKNGTKLTIQTTEIVDKQKLVRRIVDNKQFGGTWTLLYEGDNQSCKLTITENSELYNPIFRFFSLFMKPGATIEKYIESAGVALGTSVARIS
jgi:hypothetical protein